MDLDELNSRYDAVSYFTSRQELLRQLQEGYFGLAPQHEFDPIVKHLTEENDPYFTLKDFDAYVRAQEKIDTLYADRNAWNKMSVINTAASGVFSSDNTIRKYADEIWNV